MRKLIYLFPLISIIILACNLYSPVKCINGKGEIKTEVRQVGYFNSIKLLGISDVYITASDKISLEVSDYENLLPLLKTEVQGKTLVIKFEKCVNNSRSEVRITMPELKELKVLGAGDVYITGEFKPQNLVEVNISGSGNAKINGYLGDNIKAIVLGSGDLTLNLTKSIQNLTIKLTGSGDIRVKGGKSNNLFVETLGSGDFNAEGLQTSYVKIISSGSGDTKIYVTDTLEARLLGSGDLIYKGNPQKIKIKSLGSGEVIH